MVFVALKYFHRGSLYIIIIHNNFFLASTEKWA